MSEMFILKAVNIFLEELTRQIPTFLLYPSGGVSIDGGNSLLLLLLLLLVNDTAAQEDPDSGTLANLFKFTQQFRLTNR